MISDRLFILRGRIDEAIGGRVKALAFEKATNRRFKRQTLQSWIDGETWPDAAELQALADLVHKPLEWFYGFEKPEPVVLEAPGTVMVPVLDVEASAGAGRLVDVVKAEAEFAFPAYFLGRLLGALASRAKLSSLRARGNSMEPTILDGALLIVDEAQKELPKPPSSAKMRRSEPDIYVFFTSDGLRLKRLRRIDDEFVAIMSDNIHAHPPEIFKPGRDGKLTIIGKVIWWDNRL